jgi:flagellar capping protein FliD
MSSATDLTTGYLTSAETSRKERIEQLQTSIDKYEVRLTARQKNLKAYWAALEVSLSNLQQKSTSLASQIGGLSTGSSS